MPPFFRGSANDAAVGTGLPVYHPMELLAESLAKKSGGTPPRGRIMPGADCRANAEKRAMELQVLLEEKREAILSACARHGASNVRVFGSVARGEAGPHSDVDVLVDLEAGRSLLDHAALMLELEEILGCKVDVVTERGLRERIRDRVLREAVPL